jgi:glycosyl transferase family 25
MDLPVYVVHYTPLKERRTHMEDELKKYNINAKYITDYDRENLTEEDLNKFAKKNDKYCIKMSEISLARKQIAIYEEILEKDYDAGVIFEDDVCLFDDFLAKFMIYYYDLPDDWDVFFFGSGWNLHVPEKIVKESNKNVFLKTNNGVGNWSVEVYRDGWPICGGSTRCLDSYVIRNSAVKRIMEEINKTKIGYAFDLFLNQLFRKLDLKVYWGEPSLCKQDTFESSLKK